MYSILLLCCLALMWLLFKEHCLRSGRIHINPVFGLLAGMCFYVLLPCTVIVYSGEALASVTVYENYMTSSNATYVMAFALVLLAALRVGMSLAAPKRRKPAGRMQTRPAGGYVELGRSNGGNTAGWMMFGSYALLLLLAFQIRDFLFGGYDEAALASDAVWSARGAMSSSYSLIYLSICAIVLRHRGSPPARMRNAMVLIFLSASVILLSLGARLYVAMALLSLLATHSLLRDGMPAMRLGLYLLGGAISFGSIGVLRSASLTDLAGVVLNIALEPLLTSISLFTLLSDNPLILIGKPYMFLADFKAILPSFLFPGKADLFDRLNDYGYAFEAPVGGYHFFFSSLINFGVFGSLVLAVPCGYALGRLSGQRPFGCRSTALTSIFMTGALAFTIFRDPFFISVVKNLFVMAWLVPKLLDPITLHGRGLARRTMSAASRQA